MGLNLLLGLWQSRDLSEWSTDRNRYRSVGSRLLQLGEPLLAFDVLTEGLKHWSEDVALRQLQASSLLRAGASSQAEKNLDKLEREQEKHPDEETLGLLAHVHKGYWQQQKDNPQHQYEELLLTYKYYLKAYQLTNGYWTGINAATTAFLLGRRKKAKAIARRVRASCLAEIHSNQKENSDEYWLFATLGEASLILENQEEAKSWYTKAAQAGLGRFGDLASTRRNIHLIHNYLRQEWSDLDQLLHIPRVVVFSGHMIDKLSRPTRRFPEQIEHVVREEIRRRLEELKAGFGYASAANGSDILFLETLLDMGGEVHVVLPYNKQQFLSDSVDTIPNSNWAARYERVLEQASEVLVVSEQKIEEGSISYEYANLVLHGLAQLRAAQLDTKMFPLAVWDGRSGDDRGGTASTVKQWRSAGLEVEVIDLSQLLPQARNNHLAVHQNIRLKQRKEAKALSPEIKALLFADTVHFSKLSEDQIPLYLRYFLGAIAELLNKTKHTLEMTNTWGDALFLVFKSINAAGDFALDLCDLINQTKWEEKGLPSELNLRIALHAGPVYSCRDPVSRKPNFFGSHVNYAARIEPITPPGQVYASQAFAALAAASNDTHFTCDYVGLTSLAKDYGTFPTFHVHR